MSNRKDTFQLDITGGAVVLQHMAAPTCAKSADAISQRAAYFLGAMTNTYPVLRVENGIGEPNKRGGRRAYTKIKTSDLRRGYRGTKSLIYQAIKMAMDAGKI